ncbi:SDR family NAD(P)-dependent oxidoreductase [Priestia megaterium]|uniref:SDR family NAD(P)-dependent oxidoreductase n=1 Tax=Priestia megaterium TaxID=1404 RepID=UPI00366CAB83
MNRLSGKVAIITGAAAGMGEAEARLFAKEGAKIIATDLQKELLKKVVDDINETYPDAAIAVFHNVADEEQWKLVIRQTLQAFGKIDILVNNAGVTGEQVPYEERTVQEWHQVMNINALSNFLGIKYAAPEIKKVGGGSIVNISSLAGIIGMGGISPYGASKGATRTLTKGAAMELGKDNIRVNSIHPGYINTDMVSKVFQDESERSKLVSNVALPYIGEAVDVANAVLFLASDEARFITGGELVIDGGQSVIV